MKILIVEDSQETREALKNILKDTSYQNRSL